jgi:CheY-like chemotaxis protein
MSEPPASQFVGTVLLVSSEQQACDVISDSLRPLAIRTEICKDAHTAFDFLEMRKFEAVIVDSQLGDQAESLHQHLQASHTQKTSVTFAITTEGNPSDKPKATFVLHRPLTVASVSQTMKAAYGMVIRERRRYFRCPVAVLAVVNDGAASVTCETVNLSEGGVAIRFRTSIPDNAQIIQFALPGCASAFSVGTRTCWRYPSGVMGLEFQSFPPNQKAELQEWLARKLEQALPIDIAEMVRSFRQL